MPQLSIEQAFDQAVQLHNSGRLQEAEQLYRQILAQQPNHANSLHFLGIMAAQIGRNDLAVELIERAIAISPNAAEMYGNLGTALRQRGDLNGAIAAYRRAIGLNPNLVEAHANLAVSLLDQGQVDDAISASRRAIALNPNYPDAHHSLANALRQSGQVDESIAGYRRAIDLQPNDAAVHNNLAVAFGLTGKMDEAIAAFRKAIALRPNFIEAQNNLGITLAEKGDLDDAIIAANQAITLNPNYSEAYHNLGNALRLCGRLDEAIVSFRRAVAINPSNSGAHSNLVYTLHFHPAYDARALANEHRIWNQQYAEPLLPQLKAYPNDRNPDRRLKIGYVSADFREHVVGINLVPLFQNRDRSQFDITCYSHAVRTDSITDCFRENADTWRNIGGQSHDAVATQITDDRIDILVDLALHMANNRLLLFARKPAPVQVTFAGYPGSTGLTAIDYRLSDPYLDPPGMDESVYSEKTIRLPHSFWCYQQLQGMDVPVNALPAQSAGFVTFGCLNNFCKINDGVLALWAKVLRQIENSHLLVLAPPGSHRQRLLDRLAQEAIDPARVDFVSHQRRRAYLETYHRIDVGLDTHPYNGHTTSLDSLWMGVPVVTLTGQTAVSRAGWSQLSNLGLTELAAQTPDQFAQIAAALANDLPRLKNLRATLRSRMERSPLMDAAGFAGGIEAAYRRMWRGWCQSPNA